MKQFSEAEILKINEKLSENESEDKYNWADVLKNNVQLVMRLIRIVKIK